MSGYFDRLIQSYGPKPAGPAAHMPWMAEVAAEPDTATPAADLTAQPPVADIPPGPAPAAPPADLQDPAPFFEPQTDMYHGPSATDTPPAEDPIRVERLTERIIERQTGEPAPALEPLDADTPAPPAQIVEMQDLHETHVHLSETHIHKAPDMLPAAEPAFTPDPPAPESEPEVAQDSDDRDGALAALEAHLAKAFAGLQATQQQPPVTVIEPADFEPEGTNLPPPAEIETIREVTREIVREVHHHHETRIEPPPRPAPRSAAEASRIGPISFASAWYRQWDAR